MAQEQVAFDIDPRAVLSAIKQMNTAVEGYERGAVGANERLNAAVQRQADILLRVNDKQRNSMESLTRSIEKQAAAIGKSGAEKLIAQRDQIIKRLGDEKGMVDRVTAAYDKMIKAQAGEGSGRFKEFGEGIARFVEQPLNAARDAVSGFLSKAGAMGGIIAGGILAMTALATVGYEAAKSLGEFGTRIQDVELRTGLGAEEVARFSFAAKAVGQDISVVERTMRGLTVAIEDNSSKGEQARKTLQSFGVDVAGVKAGLVPTSAVLLQVSEGLGKLPGTWERNKAALDLFKRAGIETIPFMLELAENTKRASELGLPAPTQVDIERFRGYQKEIAEIDTRWDALVRKMKEVIAVPTLFVFKGIQSAASAPGGIGDIISVLLGSKPGKQDYDLSEGSPLLDILKRQLADRQVDRTAYLRKSGGLEGAQGEAERLKKLYDEARADVSKTIPQIEQARMAYQHQTDTVKELQKEESRRIAGLEKARDLIKEGESFYRFGSATGDVFITGQDIANSNLVRRPPSLRTPTERTTIDQANAPLAFPLQEGIQQFGSQTAFVSPSSSRVPLSGQSDAARIAASESLQQDEQLRRSLLNYQEEAIRLEAQEVASKQKLYSFGESAALRAARETKLELDTAKEIYKLRVASAQTAGEAQQAGISYLETQARIQADADSKHDQELQKQIDTLAGASERLFNTLFTKPSEFGRQLTNTLRTALLKPITEGLAGITANVLHPLVYGADGNGGIAGSMKGLFGGGKKDPVAATDSNTAATMQNSFVMAGLTAIIAGGMGIAAPTVPGLSGVGFSAPSISVPSISTPASGGGGWSISNIAGGAFSPIPGIIGLGSGGGFSGSTGEQGMSWAGPGGGTTAMPGILGGLLGPGGTAGFVGPLGAVMRGGSGAAAGTASGGILGSLRGLGTVFGGSTWSGIGGNLSNYGSHTQTWADGTSITQGGTLSDLATSPGAGTPLAGAITSGGVALAEHGLLGNARGTFSGTLQGAAGGFLVAGPIGAAIGFGIGVGEQIAGVESPFNKVKRLARQLYNVTNLPNSEVNQILSLAKSKYLNNIDVTMRSPELRSMLALYAAGTGQGSKFPLSASTPHAGSLVEQGGSLFQATTSQFGNQYAYSSNLPVVGGPVAGTYPNNVVVQNLSLSVGGTGAAQFVAGNVVTPDFVASQAASAQASSNGRVQGSALVQQPGLITA